MVFSDHIPIILLPIYDNNYNEDDSNDDNNKDDNDNYNNNNSYDNDDDDDSNDNSNNNDNNDNNNKGKSSHVSTFLLSLGKDHVAGADDGGRSSQGFHTQGHTSRGW